MVEQARGAIDERAHLFALAVQDAQRIGLQSPTAVFVKRRAVRGEVIDQALTIGLARIQRAQRIELERETPDAQLPPQARAHENNLGIHVRALQPERLDADLVKLPIAPFLRTLVAEHGTRIPKALNLIVKQTVLDARAHGSGSALGA